MMLRKCKDCGLEADTEDDLDLFIKDKTCKHGRANVCKKCASARGSQWAAVNKEHVAEYQKQRYQANKERRLESMKKWRENNRHKVNAITAKRRSAKLNATPAWADHEIINDFYLEAKYHGMEVDHIIPLIHKLVCGLHVEHNLQLLTKEQNCSKGNSFETL